MKLVSKGEENGKQHAQVTCPSALSEIALNCAFKRTLWPRQLPYQHESSETSRRN